MGEVPLESLGLWISEVIWTPSVRQSWWKNYGKLPPPSLNKTCVKALLFSAFWDSYEKLQRTFSAGNRVRNIFLSENSPIKLYLSIYRRKFNIDFEGLLPGGEAPPEFWGTLSLLFTEHVATIRWKKSFITNLSISCSNCTVLIRV